MPSGFSLGCLCQQISGGGRWRQCRCGGRAGVFIQNAPQIHRLIHPTRIFSFEMGSAPVTISPPHVPAHTTMSEIPRYQTTANTFSCSASTGLFLVRWDRVRGPLHWFTHPDQVTHHQECGQLLCNVCCRFAEAVYTLTVRWVCGASCVGLEWPPFADPSLQRLCLCSTVRCKIVCVKGLEPLLSWALCKVPFCSADISAWTASSLSVWSSRWF